MWVMFVLVTMANGSYMLGQYKAPFATEAACVAKAQEIGVQMSPGLPTGAKVQIACKFDKDLREA